MGYTRRGLRGYLGGFGTVNATGRITAAGFTSSTEGSAGTPAYNFSAATNQGLASVAGVKVILAVSGASQFAVANGAIDTESGAIFRANSRFELGGTVSAALTASQNNYAGPSGGNLASVWRLTPDAARTITGVVAQGVSAVLVIENCETTAGRNITLSNEDALSTAANRILCPSSTSLVIVPGGAAKLLYDSTSSRWRAFPLY